MIASAGSTDPLDRLWAWIHPRNFFGYADLATETVGYGDFVAELGRHGDRLEAADKLIVQGLRNNGPLYALGYQLSAGIAREEGTRAVAGWLSKGPVSFVLQANSQAQAEETALLPDEVVAAVRDLQKLIR